MDDLSFLLGEDDMFSEDEELRKEKERRKLAYLAEGRSLEDGLRLELEA